MVISAKLLVSQKRMIEEGTFRIIVYSSVFVVVIVVGLLAWYKGS